MLELWPIAVLGFLGSFGHCLGMCGPLTVAFSLSSTTANKKQPQGFRLFLNHLLLNLGRILSYALVGAAIGGLGSVAIAGGQMAGIGSQIRRAIAIIAGIVLILLGLRQSMPDLFPRLPVLHPLAPSNWHDRLNAGMTKLAQQKKWWTPACLGMVWGLIPCGFLYVAQIKAAETVSPIQGATTMLAFGLGTLPTMVGVGLFAASLSADKRSQLYRLGGWVTLTIGILTLARTGEMVDYTGYGSLFCLMLALVARPISRLWPSPLRYRRVLGVGAFVLAAAHAGYALDHTLNWNIEALFFMLPLHQLGMGSGILAFALMLPAAATSFDRLQQSLGKRWRQIHLLAVPALVLVAIHAIAIGSHYLGALQWTTAVKFRTALLAAFSLGVLLLRRGQTWSLFSVEKFYTAPIKPKE